MYSNTLLGSMLSLISRKLLVIAGCSVGCGPLRLVTLVCNFSHHFMDFIVRNVFEDCTLRMVTLWAGTVHYKCQFVALCFLNSFTLLFPVSNQD